MLERWQYRREGTAMTDYTEHDSQTNSTVTQLLSPSEICHELQIPLQTFYQWRAKGIGPHAYRIGRHLRVSRTDFQAWLLLRSDP
ncbi:helix-turn-helix domain-containing protein [Arthrobacter sp. GMC3]|uniref:helix-turn-helix domain-containing protein n=1 Tax=Arthrobacter sp. GMC3 TaxID=2058894 RepID=UPI0034CF5FC8